MPKSLVPVGTRQTYALDPTFMRVASYDDPVALRSCNPPVPLTPNDPLFELGPVTDNEYAPMDPAKVDVVRAVDVKYFTVTGPSKTLGVAPMVRMA